MARTKTTAPKQPNDCKAPDYRAAFDPRTVKRVHIHRVLLERGHSSPMPVSRNVPLLESSAAGSSMNRPTHCWTKQGGAMAQRGDRDPVADGHSFHAVR